MSSMTEFGYLDLLGKKVHAVYKVEDQHGVQLLLLNFGDELLGLDYEEGHRLRLTLYTVEEWQRKFEDVEVTRYYPYNCFEGKVIENILLIDRTIGKEVFEVSFMDEAKKIRIGVVGDTYPMLDLDMIRPGFTVNFGNMSIEEVDALINDREPEDSHYALMEHETREVYYYYSSVDNVFELAGYIHDIYKKSRPAFVDRPRSYELARKLICA